MTPPTISRIGNYAIIDILGRGGMGLVYRGFDKHLAREVAIKTITEGFVGDPEMLERFYREAAKTGVLKHPNIVTVYTLGEQDGFPYIVMEFVAGEPLDKMIRSNRAIPLLLKLQIIEQVCHALGYAHKNDIIHRDVKPANIMVQPDGVAKLLDFGIARQEKTDLSLTRTGSIVGTIPYMAPERLRNSPFDGRSDIFSTGVVLFQLLTGHLPFSGEESELVRKLLNDKPASLSTYLAEYPLALDGILERSLEKDPDARYATAEEMAVQLFAVSEELKKQRVTEIFHQAEQLVTREEFTKAREILLEVIKLDAQHTAARELMGVVQKSLAQRQRADQIRQLRSQADGEMRGRQFDEAIGHLEQALRLDSANPELGERLEFARQKKRTGERIEMLLKQAEGARGSGNFESAQAIIGRALELDKEDSRVQAAYSQVVREAEEAARQAKSQKLIESARSQINESRFSAAIRLLNEAEELDSSNPAIFSLLNAAKSGLEQERLRHVLEQIQTGMATASSPEELLPLFTLANEALHRMPGQPSLLKFKAQLEQRIKQSEMRKFVDEAVKRCRVLVQTSPQEALDIVKEGLQRYPENERLLVLQTSVEEQLSEWSLKQARAKYLARAHAALNNRQYAEAVNILEGCHSEGILSGEIAELLDFARGEAELQRRQAVIDKSSAYAQDLLKKGAYDELINFLEPIVRETDDASLRTLLDGARNQLQAVQQKIDIARRKLEALVQGEQYDFALSFAESQPPSVAQSEAIQSLLTRARKAREDDHAVLEVIARAYAALSGPDIDSGWGAFQIALHTYPESPLLERSMRLFEVRREPVANRALAAAIEISRSALQTGEAKLAAKALRDATAYTEYASPELKNEWSQLKRKAAKDKLLIHFKRKSNS